MKAKYILGIAFLFTLSTLIGCSSEQKTISSPAEKPLIVFLVRHGEKVDHSSDAILSAAGEQRAVALATILRDAEIEYVHSSDFIRTRDTATPLANAHGLEVELYDPKNLPKLVDKLKEKRGRHLVVGHSDTTPAMVKLLGSDPGSRINDESEYDRLYIVTITNDNFTNCVMLRYGNEYIQQ